MEIQAPGIGAADVTRQTERIVASRVFAKAKRSQRLLRYLVDAALVDPPQLVKEYTLAVDVFDRDASYDPAIDATVRVEAGRLRTRLREYYGEEGREDALLIKLPKGTYCAVVTLRGELQEQSARHHKTNSASDTQLAVKDRQGLSLRSETITGTNGEWAAPAASEEHHPAASSREFSQGARADRWTMGQRIWLYVAPVLVLGLALGYAGWSHVRRTTVRPRIRSVAVLPLRNLSGDPAQDYFADGTTDELITELARVPELRVVSWNSVVQEKDTKKPLKTIAQELRADLLVEGSVSRSGETVRINTQLVDANNDNHLWASSFEGPMSEMMALENKAAEEIVGHARVEGPTSGPGGGTGNAARPSTAIDPAAHEAYLRGKNYFDKRQGAASAEQFQRAIDLSPGYASAYSGLSTALQTVAVNEATRPEPVIAKAMAAANRALELDPDNGDALIARGAIETTFLWQWEAAKRDLTRGSALSPSNSYGHMMLSVYLQSEGRSEDAVRQMQEAIEMDPLSFFMARQYGTALYFAHRYDEALRQLQYAREMHPASAGVVDHWITDVYEKKGMYDDAIRYDLLDLQDDHQDPDSTRLLAAYHRDGWQGYWAVRVQEIRNRSTDACYDRNVGIAAMRAGRHEEAVAALQRAADKHCYWMAVARTDPILDDLRGDPGFSDVLAGLHLPPDARREAK